jgi:hypothetical protein
MSVKKFAVALCCLAVVTAGAVEAAKLKIKNLPVEDVFPGVDDFGDLDFGNTFDGTVNIAINLKNGKATISGKAVVDNFSGGRAVFVDEDLAGIGTLVHDRYVVKANGKASYNGKYEDVTL